jgi:thymidylate kinase
MNAYLIEGLDRLGKSTLIESILQARGYHQIIHYSKPRVLEYHQPRFEDEAKNKSYALREYQYHSFRTMMGLVRAADRGEAKLIMDRAHLGEYVYAPLYRNYDAGYIFDLETDFFVDKLVNTKLILLTENFEISKHFADDGESLGPESARAKEQEMFLAAFEKSRFSNKKIICVTGEDGNFRPKEAIFFEAML